MKQPENKHQRLIETAIRLINRLGISDTTTAQISAEAGVATGTLYTYFKSKRELIEACYTFCAQSNYEYCIQGLENIASPLGKLTQRAINAMHWGLENPELLQFQLAGYFKQTLILHDHVDQYTADIRTYMQEAQLLGEVKPLPCELLVELELGALGFALGYVYRHQAVAKEEGFIRKMVEAAMDSVRAKGTAE